MSSLQSQQQILQDVHDPAAQRLRVDAEVTATIGDVEVDIAYQEDSIAIGDPSSGNILKINSDGSINTALSINPTTTEIFYNEVSSVASGVSTSVLTYNVSQNNTKLQRIDVSGDNIALYQVTLNSSIIDKQRTYFGNSLNSQFEFNGVNLSNGDEIEVTVTHNRPSLANFNAKVVITI